MNSTVYEPAGLMETSTLLHKTRVFLFRFFYFQLVISGLHNVKTDWLALHLKRKCKRWQCDKLGTSNTRHSSLHVTHKSNYSPEYRHCHSCLLGRAKSRTPKLLTCTFRTLNMIFDTSRLFLQSICNVFIWFVLMFTGIPTCSLSN